MSVAARVAGFIDLGQNNKKRQSQRCQKRVAPTQHREITS